jgi:hypothetical protein
MTLPHPENPAAANSTTPWRHAANQARRSLRKLSLSLPQSSPPARALARLVHRLSARM